jgi:hypothetical protein
LPVAQLPCGVLVSDAERQRIYTTYLAPALSCTSTRGTRPVCDTSSGERGMREGGGGGGRLGGG